MIVEPVLIEKPAKKALSSTKSKPKASSSASTTRSATSKPKATKSTKPVKTSKAPEPANLRTVSEALEGNQEIRSGWRAVGGQEKVEAPAPTAAPETSAAGPTEEQNPGMQKLLQTMDSNRRYGEGLQAIVRGGAGGRGNQTDNDNDSDLETVRVGHVELTRDELAEIRAEQEANSRREDELARQLEAERRAEAESLADGKLQVGSDAFVGASASAEVESDEGGGWRGFLASTADTVLPGSGEVVSGGVEVASGGLDLAETVVTNPGAVGAEGVELLQQADDLALEAAVGGIDLVTGNDTDPDAVFDAGLFQTLFSEHEEGGSNWSWGIEQFTGGVVDFVDQQTDNYIERELGRGEQFAQFVEDQGFEGTADDLRLINREYTNALGGASNAAESAIDGFGTIVAHPVATATGLVETTSTINDLALGGDGAQIVVDSLAGNELNEEQQGQVDFLKDLAGGSVQDYVDTYNEYGVSGVVGHFGSEVLVDVATGGSARGGRVGLDVAAEVVEGGIERELRDAAGEVAQLDEVYLPNGRRGQVDNSLGEVSQQIAIDGDGVARGIENPAELELGESYLLEHRLRPDAPPNYSRREFLGLDSEGQPLWGESSAAPPPPGFFERNVDAQAGRDRFSLSGPRRGLARAERQNLELERLAVNEGRASSPAEIRAAAENVRALDQPRELNLGQHDLPVHGIRDARELSILRDELEQVRAVAGDRPLDFIDEIVITNNPGLAEFGPGLDRAGGWHLARQNPGDPVVIVVERSSLGRDRVATHEIGHGVDDALGNGSYVNSLRPDSAFDSGAGDALSHVSDYATTNALEDFAETFRTFVERPDVVQDFLTNYPDSQLAAKFRELQSVLGTS